MRKEKIKQDINRISEVVNRNQLDELREVFREMYSTYRSEIPGIDDMGTLHPLWDGSINIHNLYADVSQQKPRRELTDNYKKNLVIISSKLMLLSGEENPNSGNGVNVHIHNDNTSSAANTVKMEINISYSDVKKQVEAMEDSIGYDEVQAIKAKIDELEKIIESSARRSEKWNKAKAIGKWIFDKSVDVGIAMLPLLLKI